MASRAMGSIRVLTPDNMNLQSYSYLQNSSEVIGVNKLHQKYAQQSSESFINLRNQAVAMIGSVKEASKPPANNSRGLESPSKVQRRTSGQKSRPAPLMLQSKPTESKQVRKLSNASDTQHMVNGRKVSTSSNPPGTPVLNPRAGLTSSPKVNSRSNPPGTPNTGVQQSGNNNNVTVPVTQTKLVNRDTGKLQRSESFYTKRQGAMEGMPQKSGLRRNATFTPGSMNVSNKRTQADSLLINSTPVSTPRQNMGEIIRKTSGKKLPPRQPVHNNNNNTQGGTASMSTDFFNIENYPLAAKSTEMSIVLDSKSTESSAFKTGKQSSGAVQSNFQNGEESINAQSTSKSESTALVALQNPEAEYYTKSTYDMKPADSFVKSMDTIRLSTVTFDTNPQTDSQLLSQSTVLDPILWEEEPQFDRGGLKIVDSLSVGAKTLHRRGIANRERLENHPLPEQRDEVLSHATAFTRYTYPDGVSQVSNYADPPYSIPTAAVSGRSSPSQTDTSHSWAETSPGWAGNTTERSSEYSLGEDEFDRTTGLQVRRLFEEIDAMLFENKNNSQGPQHLQGECKDWVSQFPHIRILGKQLVPPQDFGFQMIPGSQRSQASENLGLVDVTERDISLGHAFHELTVSGQQVSAKSQILPQFSVDPDEEIFAEDGSVEDIIAVDFTSTDEDLKSAVTGIRSRRKGLPPMTPQACVKDNLTGASFDSVWAQVISWLQPVHNKFVQDAISDTIVSAAEHQRTQNNLVFDEHAPAPYEEEDTLTPRQRPLLPLDPLLATSPSRENVNAPSREASNLSTSRGVEKGGKLIAGGTVKELKRSPELAGVLTVSSKAIQMKEGKREKSNIQFATDSTEQLGSPSLRPPSSLLKLTRPGSHKVGDLPSSNRNPSARQKPSLASRHMSRLQPLDRAKTPSEEDTNRRLHNEVLKGHRISMPSDHMGQGMSQYPMMRNGPLPPIGHMERETSENNISVTLERRQQQQAAAFAANQRASSAVHHDNKENRLHTAFRESSFRENRTSLPIQLDNRPSTTHAFRSDSATPFGIGGRRSQTPLGMMGVGTMRTPYNPGAGGLGASSNLNPRGRRSQHNTAVR